MFASPSDVLRDTEASAWNGASRDYILECLEDLLVARAGCTDARKVAKRLRLLCGNASLMDSSTPAFVSKASRAARVWQRQAAWARWRTMTQTALCSVCSGRCGMRASNPPHDTTVP